MLWYFVSIMFKLLCITCTRTTGRGNADRMKNLEGKRVRTVLNIGTVTRNFVQSLTTTLGSHIPVFPSRDNGRSGSGLPNHPFNKREMQDENCVRATKLGGCRGKKFHEQRE
jgi:hypothetical protein